MDSFASRVFLPLVRLKQGVLGADSTLSVSNVLYKQGGLAN